MALLLREELLKKVRQIEISTKKLVSEVMTGQYRSHFRGHGMQFSEHRLYVAGDDVRHMDWKASARVRDPLVKKFEEERELTVFLVVDVSGSEQFGSHSAFKSEVAAEVGAMLAYAATHSGDRVGVLLFASEVEKIIPPAKGRNHLLRVIRTLLSHENRTQKTNLREALDSAGRVMKHAGIVFVLSDFMAADYSRSLQRLGRKHDVVAVRISDRRETAMPRTGVLLVQDPETGEEAYIDTSSAKFQNWIKAENKKRNDSISQQLKSSGVECLNLTTQEDYGKAVVRFFQQRKRR
jgi:uncharacterized protein (DUF58 family)